MCSSGVRKGGRSVLMTLLPVGNPSIPSSSSEAPPFFFLGLAFPFAAGFFPG
jgi:hypothetical protein